MTIVLHQCHIQEHLSAMRGDLDAVVEMVAKSSKEIKFSKAVDALTKSAEQMIGGRGAKAAFLVYDDAQEVLRVARKRGDEKEANFGAVKLGSGIVGMVAKTKKEIIIEDAKVRVSGERSQATS